MKTSQKIAEEMAVQTSMSWMAREDKGIAESILQEIPLTQLIEVARAAARHTRALGHVEQTNTLGLLIDAKIALQKTEKAEWL